MSDDDKPVSDDPLSPYDGDGRSPHVIDLASVRIAWGFPKNRYNRCKHQHLVYSDTERRVYCEDCKRDLEGFDAFMIVVRMFQKMLMELRAKRVKADEAMASTLIRRAAKSMDRTWGHKMAPLCPHCHGGLLPEDFENGGSACSRELEVARRKRAES